MSKRHASGPEIPPEIISTSSDQNTTNVCTLTLRNQSKKQCCEDIIHKRVTRMTELQTRLKTLMTSKKIWTLKKIKSGIKSIDFDSYFRSLHTQLQVFRFNQKLLLYQKSCDHRLVFGKKYRGKLLTEIPWSYINWILENGQYLNSNDSTQLKIYKAGRPNVVRICQNDLTDEENKHTVHSLEVKESEIVDFVSHIELQCPQVYSKLLVTCATRMNREYEKARETFYAFLQLITFHEMYDIPILLYDSDLNVYNCGVPRELTESSFSVTINKYQYSKKNHKEQKMYLSKQGIDNVFVRFKFACFLDPAISTKCFDALMTQFNNNFEPFFTIIAEYASEIIKLPQNKTENIKSSGSEDDDSSDEVSGSEVDVLENDDDDDISDYSFNMSEEDSSSSSGEESSFSSGE